MAAEHPIVLTFKVTLFESEPLIWRRVSIPQDFNFYQLHLALQAAFGWENCHLFQFSKNGLGDDHGIGVPGDDLFITDARKVRLKKIFRQPGGCFVYVYDFGDHWQHIIELEAISKKEIYAAICEGGENECPPEDVGSMSGYQEMLRVFLSGLETEKEEFRNWLGLSTTQGWDAHYFNQREINKRMALLSPENLTF